MLPVLQLGPLTFPTYPLMLMLAGWLGLWVASRVAARLGMDGDHLYNAGLGGFVAGVIAGRLGHVITFWPAYRQQPLEIVGLNLRAFLLWPALLAAVLFVAWYVHRHRLSWPSFADAAAPGLLAGAAIALLGALLAGQAYGRPANLPWAITLWDVRRHPSQIYEMIAVLLVLGGVLWLIRRRRAPGTAAWAALLGYGLSRWLLEPFRAESATILGGLRLPQVLGLLAVLVALWVGRRGSREQGIESRE